MLRPTVGDLLKGINASLRQSVLPSIGPGAAQRQLKAALHALGRLEKSWDLLPAYLAEDNADMHRCLETILNALKRAGVQLPASVALQRETLAKLPESQELPISGFNDRALAIQGALNASLQALIVELDRWLRAPSQMAIEIVPEQTLVLDQLYGRMVDRELRAWATESQET